VVDSDIVARWGGDEFIVLFHAEHESGVKRFTHRMDDLFMQQNLQPEINDSYGYALINPDKKTALEDRLKIADEYMHQNKQNKK